MKRRSMIQVALVVFGLTVGGIEGTAPLPGLPARSSAPSEPTPRLLAVCIDALQVDTFERLLGEGRLPHISRLLVGRPSIRGRALSSFPSSTAPSVTET